MSPSTVVRDLKVILDQHQDQYEIDVDKVHDILKTYNGNEYLEIANAAFSRFLDSNDSQYKGVFGIAITYARDRGGDLNYEDWNKFSKLMQGSVKKFNVKHEEQLDWNRLPSDSASMKTMVFTILNRDMMSSIVSNFKKRLRAPVVSRVKNFASGAQEKQR